MNLHTFSKHVLCYLKPLAARLLGREGRREGGRREGREGGREERREGGEIEEESRIEGERGKE